MLIALLSSQDFCVAWQFMEPYSDAYFTEHPGMEDSKAADGGIINGGKIIKKEANEDSDRMDLMEDDAPPPPNLGTSHFSNPFAPSSPDRAKQTIEEDVEMVDSTTGPKTKKKGTAALVKKRKSGSKKAAKAARKGSTASASAAKAASSAAGDSDDGSDADEESDHGPYCICRGPDDHRWMIGCDVCEDWFHGDCVNLDKTIGETLIQRYVCPNCTDGKRNMTRYKKTCSLEGCKNVARVYNAAEPSVFCSDRHAEEWWEQLVASLPRDRDSNKKNDGLTREQFMGLLNKAPTKPSGDQGSTWKLGDAPFGVPPDFWSRPEANSALTEEESSFLNASATERYMLAEEIVLNKKMQQLLDMASDRRKAAISAGKLESDGCGYDVRLDVVGAPAQFAAFLQSPRGEAIFKAGKLDVDLPHLAASGRDASFGKAADSKDDYKALDHPLTAGMCEKRRCKPHAGWHALFTKGCRHSIKELAAQAKEKLDAETRVRDAAATRFYRKKREQNHVEVIGSDDSDRDMMD